jgi:hypothetical protein
MPLWGERQMVRLTPRGTADDEPPPRLQCPQAATDCACILLQGLHQLFMATDDNTSRTLVVRDSPLQDTLVQSRQTWRGHGSPPHMPLP